MQAGLLNRTIEVYKPVKLTSPVGSTTTEWAKMYETRANVRHVSMNRSYDIAEINYPMTREFIIRSYNNIDPYFRIKYQNDFYRIISIDKRREMNDILILADLVND